jgi:sugar lactone lactonase YvrE
MEIPIAQARIEWIKGPMKKKPAMRFSLMILAALFKVGSCWAQNYTITTFAGAIAPKSGIGDDGPATAASIGPAGLAMDSSGNVYIADITNNVVRKVTPDGMIASIAGDAANQRAGYAGDQGPATSALLTGPFAVALDSVGSLYISERPVGRVRRVDPNGIITTVAGGGVSPTDGGPATQAILGQIGGVAADLSGNPYIASVQFDTVRKVGPDGTITTVAGCGSAAAYLAPDGTVRLCAVGTLNDNGPATNAWLDSPTFLAVDPAGNLYISDLFFNRIRKVTGDGTITTVAGSGTASYTGDGGLAVSAGISGPFGVAVDGAGNLFIADSQDHRIRMVTPDGSIVTIAGNGTQGTNQLPPGPIPGEGGPATGVALNIPDAITVGPDGSVYFSDFAGRVMRLTPN